MQATMSWCEQRFHYRFKDDILLQTALTHRSHSVDNNERLEFLGDAALDLVISELLYQSYSGQTEGSLSRMRSSLVKGNTLAELAKELDVGDYLILGKGENTSGGRERLSLLSDALEAMIGAIFLDGGYVAVKNVIIKIFDSRIQALDPKSEHKDHKSILQEKLQGEKQGLPVYSLVRSIGDHNKTFVVECSIKSGEIVTQASGKTLRVAEQKAASKALQAMQND
ncbi:MAG: ribonuclease III [Gammaproteobacteria bacterium]|jgi:ribonuclease-3|nr:ribonuclease III [Gammaproteobacteria bacterium]HIK96793.1 ribonuclease III [Gammaproteobacteria bacterium]|tara:strand:+ start:6449 stop:7123 length:675 start_codon:yes stop_codon:yes gene_type:complete